MATMNLYLPDALKAEMDEMEGVNWSRVAQDAFRATTEIERTKKVDITESGIQRLRNQREHAVSSRSAQALAAGKKWAIDEANYEELEAVAGIEFGGDAFRGDPGAYGWGVCLADALFGEGNWSRDDIEAMGERLFGKPYPGALEVEQFILGASEVFDKV